MEKEKPGRIKTEPAGGLLNCFCEEKPGKSWKLMNPGLALKALIVGSLVFSKPGRTVSLYCMVPSMSPRETKLLISSKFISLKFKISFNAPPGSWGLVVQKGQGRGHRVKEVLAQVHRGGSWILDSECGLARRFLDLKALIRGVDGHNDDVSEEVYTERSG